MVFSFFFYLYLYGISWTTFRFYFSFVTFVRVFLLGNVNTPVIKFNWFRRIVFVTIGLLSPYSNFTTLFFKRWVLRDKSFLMWRSYFRFISVKSLCFFTYLKQRLSGRLILYDFLKSDFRLLWSTFVSEVPSLSLVFYTVYIPIYILEKEEIQRNFMYTDKFRL